MAGYDIYDKTGAGCRIDCFLSQFFLVTDGINVLLLMISQPFDEDCARIVFNQANNLLILSYKESTGTTRTRTGIDKILLWDAGLAPKLCGIFAGFGIEG